MQTSLIDGLDSDGATLRSETVKSWTSFRKIFGEAERLWAVSYCDSLGAVAKLFDKLNLQRLELVVGDVSDYLERLTEKD